MKIRLLPAVLASLFLLAGAARLGAQSQPRNPNMDRALAQREINVRRLFMDQTATIYDGDVERSRALLTSLKASTYDTNHDGKLDEKEQAAWEKRLRTVLSKTPEWMKQHDLDHDKILSDAEWNAAYVEIFESGPAPTDAKK